MIVFSGAILGGAAICASFIYWPDKNPDTADPKPAQEPDKGKTFGHEFHPVWEVREGIHKPPSGHFWELGVTHDEDGASWLVLRCVQFESSTAVDEKRARLDVRERDGKGWATLQREQIERYRGYGNHMGREYVLADLTREAREQIVHGLTEWSRRTFLKYSTDPGALVDAVVIA